MLPMSNLPEAARRAMAQIGPVWGSDIQKHRDMVIAAYAPLLAQSPKDGCSAIRDIAYGAHPRQVLDVFKPDVARGVKGAKGAPVVIFVHGGAFVRGDRNVDAEIYSNTLWWFARKPRGLGEVSGAFLVGYGVFRFATEYFREPDDYLGTLLLDLSMGQWLCVPMVLSGVLLWAWGHRRRERVS